MPMKRCGDDGWKWGDSGKCYTGPGAKKKAIKQMVAEKENGAKAEYQDFVIEVIEDAEISLDEMTDAFIEAGYHGSEMAFLIMGKKLHDKSL